MKKNTLLLLTILLQTCIGAYAQFVNSEENGIHVTRGCSYDSIASSNIGTDCSATGDNSFAGGIQSLATGSCSFAFGYQSNAIPLHMGSAVALGRKCQAKETCSYAFGDNVIADGPQTFGIGFNIKTYMQNSIVIGMGQSIYDTLICKAPGITMGMSSPNPTLFISPGSSYRTGKVAIGNTYNPQAKLHIVADNEEDAGIFLQPTGNNGEISFIKMTDYNHEIAVLDDGNMRISSGTNEMAVTSINANLTSTELVLGRPNTPKLNFATDANPAIYSNAFRSGNSCRRYTQGASYAIEFNNDNLLFRTAVNQEPRGTEITNWQTPFMLKTNGNIILNGKVGINTENTTANYALAIDGGIITTKVYIQDVEDWPDYVFADNYNLMTLNDLRSYINKYRHLPNLPSQSEVTATGYDIGETQVALLKKIEELTLYTLQQQEEIEALKKIVEELSGK